MYKVEFDCELVSPMFMGNAEQKPELRPPAIRGAMRWWFRALVGGLVDGNVIAISALENDIFGSNNNSSPFQIRTNQLTQTDRFDQLPHRRTNQAHLFRQGFIPGDFISLKIVLNPWVKHNQVQLLSILKSIFILCAEFGGFGKRARRGFGSLRITKIDQHIYNEPNEIDEYKNVMQSVRNNVAAHLGLTPPLNVSRLPDFAMIAPVYTQIGISRPDTDWNSLISSLMSFMSGVKSNNGILYRDTIGEALRYRLASPLWVKMLKANNSYRLLHTHFIYSQPPTYSTHQTAQESLRQNLSLNTALSIPNWETL